MGKFLRKSTGGALRYFHAFMGCCGDELFQTWGCRYDIERFGVKNVTQPEQADLLIVNGLMTIKSMPEVMALYQKMRGPRYVMAVGSCACRGGAFSAAGSYSAFVDTKKTLPIDVFVPGCPPRPEAFMFGLMTLQEKIYGNKRTTKTN